MKDSERLSSVTEPQTITDFLCQKQDLKGWLEDPSNPTTSGKTISEKEPPDDFQDAIEQHELRTKDRPFQQDETSTLEQEQVKTVKFFGSQDILDISKALEIEQNAFEDSCEGH